MSLKSWMKEFYPIDASRFRDKEDDLYNDTLAAAKHSLKKWKGLQYHNLAKHGLFLSSGTLTQAGDLSYKKGITGSESCALCQIHLAFWNDRNCPGCPLATLDKACMHRNSVYQKSRLGSRPQEMINLLRIAVEHLKRGVL